MVTTTVTNHPLLSLGIVFTYGILLKHNFKKTIKYSTIPAWVTAYYAWRELRQARKIERLQKRIVETNQVNRGNVPIN